MSVATQISRLTALRDRIRTKLVSLGLASSSDKLAALTDEIESITAQGATTITPNESSQIAITAGKYTTGNVTVGAISNTYVGSGITRRDSTSLTASGATVSVPAGYYASAASKAIANGSAATPATTITAKPTFNFDTTTGLITASNSKTQDVTPTVIAGYVSSGTAGTITVSGSQGLQLTTKAGTTITPTESQQVAVGTNQFTLGTVYVGAISSTYVGSGIDRFDSTNLTASGATVTVPAGYYEEEASKAIASGSATTPATTVTANPSISINTSTGTITATTSATQSVTPTVSAGYVSSGTAGTITVSGSDTYTLSVQAANTVNPTETEQTAVAAGKYTTGVVKVGAISSTYVGSGITRRSSSSLTVSGRTVSVPAGYYASAASKSIGTGVARTPTTTITANPTITISSTGLITATTSASKSITPSISAGYISSGTAGTVTASGSNTQQLTTMAGQTVSLTSETETIVATNVYTLGDIIVDASDIFPDGDNESYGYPHSPSNVVGTGSAGYMII